MTIRMFIILFLFGSTVLDGPELNAQIETNPSPVFKTVLRKPGDDGSKSFRIPGLATTNAGTLIAVFDIRYDGSKDLPANIDVGAMRSVDDGQTWSPMQKILDFDQSIANSKGNGVGDPAILVDKQTNTIFAIALWSQGDRAWNGSGPGLSPDETGQLVLTKSRDDGLTWSKPINVTGTISGRDARWRLFFNGPGCGIQLRDGTLVFAAQYREASGPPHSCFLYSRDHGESWAVSPPAIANHPPTSESQIVELDDGSLLISMRDESKSGTRAWARWQWIQNSTTGADGKWVHSWSTVPDPTCMASLLKYPNGPLLFSNPNHPKQRIALTVRFSIDDGKTWSDGRLLDPRGCMYSCMTVLKDGRIGILYEVDNTLTFSRFPLEWITKVN